MSTTPPADDPSLRLRRLEAMLSAVSECFKVVDSALCLCDMNPTGLGLIEADSLEAVRGASVLDLVLPEYHGVFESAIQRALRGERVTSEFKIRGLKGTERWMQQVAVAMPPRPGETQPTEVAAFTRDISELRMTLEFLEQARSDAQAASRAKSAFLANMSHEIRTPMTAILGFADLLATDPTVRNDPEECSAAIETVRTNARQLLSLLDDILDLSKVESGQMSIESVPNDLRSLFEGAVKLHEVSAREKGIHLHVAFDPELPAHVATDPTRVRQIITNLVGNAVKFTDHGSVRVSLRSAGRPSDGATGGATPRTVVEMQVSDTGIGISPEALEQIRRFDPFTQADESMTRRYGGTGLGLGISSSIAELLGGSLEVESEEGVGTTFTARFAVTIVESGQPVDPVPASTGRSSSGRLEGVRVAVAEDGVDNQRLVGHFLKRAGAEVTIVENGELLVHALEQSDPRFDLILMDMQMPVLDGYAATAKLRTLGYDLPVIAMTAHAMRGDRDRCIEAGCDGYIAKPLTSGALVEACEKALADHAPNREVR